MKRAPRDGSAASEQSLVDPRAAAAATADTWYLVERGGHALRKIENDRITTVAGNAKAGFRDGPALQAQFDGPKHLDVAADGRVFIADDNNHAVRVYDPANGTVETVSTKPYTLRRPHGVKVFQGDLYIADSFHHRILKRPLPVAKESQ